MGVTEQGRGRRASSVDLNWPDAWARPTGLAVCVRPRERSEDGPWGLRFVLGLRLLFCKMGIRKQSHLQRVLRGLRG